MTEFVPQVHLQKSGGAEKEDDAREVAGRVRVRRRRRKKKKGRGGSCWWRRWGCTCEKCNSDHGFIIAGGEGGEGGAGWPFSAPGLDSKVIYLRRGVWVWVWELRNMYSIYLCMARLGRYTKNVPSA